MIHYHGLPITPKSELLTMAGEHFCCSFANPEQIDIVINIGQSVLLDNGAFSQYTKGKTINKEKLYKWIDKYLVHPHRAVILDKIGGSLEQQKEYVKEWPFPKDLSWPVFHLHLPLDYLLELSDNFPGICLGSSGDYWDINSEKWRNRMDEIFNFLSQNRHHMPWIHGLRMLGQCGERWPLASADSTNVARNYKNKKNRSAYVMAKNIDKINPPLRWKRRKYINQEDMFS